MFLHKWNIFIPTIHRQLVKPNHPLFHEFSVEQVDYIIAFNIGAIWNIVMKWIENDMKDSPNTIKETLLKYVKTLSLFT